MLKSQKNEGATFTTSFLHNRCSITGITRSLGRPFTASGGYSVSHP